MEQLGDCSTLPRSLFIHGCFPVRLESLFVRPARRFRRDHRRRRALSRKTRRTAGFGGSERTIQRAQKIGELSDDRAFIHVRVPADETQRADALAK